MNERELSKLSYTIAPIVNDPKRYAQVIDFNYRDEVIKPSKDYIQCLDALYLSIKTNDLDLRKASEELLKSKSDNERIVGRSLKWFLDQKEPTK